MKNIYKYKSKLNKKNDNSENKEILKIPKWIFNDEIIDSDTFLDYFNKNKLCQTNDKLIKILITKIDEIIFKLKNDNAVKRLEISNILKSQKTIQNDLDNEVIKTKRKMNQFSFTNNSIKFPQNKEFFDDILEILNNKIINEKIKKKGKKENNIPEFHKNIKANINRNNFINKIYNKKYIN